MLERKKGSSFGTAFFLGGVRELLLVFVPHLFSKFTVFVFGDFFSSFFNNATHSIFPPCSDPFFY